MPTTNTKPIAIDLFCGLGGWTAGLLAEGWDVIGFDIERHMYGEHRYPARLVLQDVRTIHGSQFKHASLIVASPPCQEFSYMAMPWTRAKKIAAEYRDGTRDRANLTALFDACFRIQREAIEAAGHFIPLVVENVRGAQPWVGRSRWRHGSFHLWGDVPALMPITSSRLAHKIESPHLWLRDPQRAGGRFAANYTKGGSWFNIAHNTISGKGQNPVNGTGPRGGKLRHDPRYPHLDPNTAHEDGVKGFTPHGGPLGKNELGRKHGSKSSARKAASAHIAKIPLPLARHIARVYFPKDSAV